MKDPLGYFNMLADHAGKHPERDRRRKTVGVDGKPTEAAIQKSILEALNRDRRVAMAWRQNAGAVKTAQGYVVRMGPTGMADIGGIMRGGRSLQIEVKRPGQNVKNNSAQDAWLKRCDKAGALCGVAHSVEEALAIVSDGNL